MSDRLKNAGSVPCRAAGPVGRLLRRMRRGLPGAAVLSAVVLSAVVLSAVMPGTVVPGLLAEGGLVRPAMAAGPEDSAASAIGLAIQGISLLNGEDGIELWRLKATWGHLSQDGDTVTVDQPVVRYTLGDPALEDYLHVRSAKGRITDNQRYLRLWDDVVLTRGEETTTGPVLDYDAKTRVLVFPEGAHIDGPKGLLDTDRLTWKLDDNRLMADGRVVAVLKAQPEPDDAGDTGSGVAGSGIAGSDITGSGDAVIR